MKFVTITACVLLALIKGTLSKGISSCGKEWMAVDNVLTNKGTIERRGYTSAVNYFCDQASGQEVGGSLYLSMATRVWMNKGSDPRERGINGYVYFEIHNKRDAPHIVDGNKCKEYLNALGRNSKCGGKKNGDTKGGTWQVGKNDVSYHALADAVVSPPDCLDKTVVHGSAIGPLEKGGAHNNTLRNFPVRAFDDVTPLACHSHNDYESHGRIALYSALIAGCVSVEADVFIDGDDLNVRHTDLLTENRGSIQDLYLNPLKRLIDENKAIFPKAPWQSLSLLVDFKDNGDKTFDMLVRALTPLRDAGYLSHVRGNTFQKRFITIIASGQRPWDKIRNTRDNPLQAVFADGYFDGDLDAFDALNTHYLSADFDKVKARPGGLPLPDKVKQDLEVAHRKGLKVRLWNGPDKPSEWQQLVDTGVDRVNVDDLANVAAVKWDTRLL